MQITKNSGDSTTSAKKEAQISNSRLILVGPNHFFLLFFIHKIALTLIIKIRAATEEKTPRCAT